MRPLCCSCSCIVYIIYSLFQVKVVCPLSTTSMLRLSERTYSLWGYLNRHIQEYINPLFKKEHEVTNPVLKPSVSPQCLKWVPPLCLSVCFMLSPSCPISPSLSLSLSLSFSHSLSLCVCDIIALICCLFVHVCVCCVVMLTCVCSMYDLMYYLWVLKFLSWSFSSLSLSISLSLPFPLAATLFLSPCVCLSPPLLSLNSSSLSLAHHSPPCLSAAVVCACVWVSLCYIMTNCLFFWYGYDRL